jgi:hypothetical protein
MGRSGVRRDGAATQGSILAAVHVLVAWREDEREGVRSRGQAQAHRAAPAPLGPPPGAALRHDDHTGGITVHQQGSDRGLVLGIHRAIAVGVADIQRPESGSAIGREPEDHRSAIVTRAPEVSGARVAGFVPGQRRGGWLRGELGAWRYHPHGLAEEGACVGRVHRHHLVFAEVGAHRREGGRVPRSLE